MPIALESWVGSGPNSLYGLQSALWDVSWLLKECIKTHRKAWKKGNNDVSKWNANCANRSSGFSIQCTRLGDKPWVVGWLLEKPLLWKWHITFGNPLAQLLTICWREATSGILNSPFPYLLRTLFLFFPDGFILSECHPFINTNFSLPSKGNACPYTQFLPLHLKHFFHLVALKCSLSKYLWRCRRPTPNHR